MKPTSIAFLEKHAVQVTDEGVKYYTLWDGKRVIRKATIPNNLPEEPSYATNNGIVAIWTGDSDRKFFVTPFTIKFLNKLEELGFRETSFGVPMSQTSNNCPVNTPDKEKWQLALEAQTLQNN